MERNSDTIHSERHPAHDPLYVAGHDITGLDETQYDNAAADPLASSTPRVRNNAGTLKVRLQDSRTNSVFRPWGLISDTSGSPAAGIGVGQLFECESADETPSSFMALDTVATNVSAGAEVTDFLVMLRNAGAALAEKFRIKGSGALSLADSAADPSSNEIARNGTIIKLRTESNQTNSVLRPFGIVATTSGSPAAGIGTGMLFESESADEAPSHVAAIDAVLTDTTSGSEDGRLDISTRVAGAALTATYGFQATGAFRATVTHANTAARTYTLPDSSGTISLGMAAPKLVTATRDMSTATGTQAITGIGFTPRYVQILAANNDEASRFSVGASDGTNHYCMFGQTTGGTGFTAVDTTKCIHLLDNAGTDFLTSTVQSLDADGLTLSHTKGGSMTGTATFIITAWP